MAEPRSTILGWQSGPRLGLDTRLPAGDEEDALAGEALVQLGPQNVRQERRLVHPTWVRHLFEDPLLGNRPWRLPILRQPV